MDAPKHTPAPWKQWDRRDIDQGIIITDQSGTAGVCRVIGESQPGDRKKANVACLANASLIVSAPELLAACEESLEVLSKYRRNNNGVVNECCERLGTAIAKAKGQQ